MTLTLTTGLVLAILLFAGCQSESAPATEARATLNAQPQASLKIVYVQLDSLQSGYADLRTEVERFTAEADDLQRDIQRQAAALEREGLQLQRQIQQGLLAPNKVSAEQQRLAGLQQNLLQRRDSEMQRLQQSQIVIQARFAERVEGILTDLREENGYDFIFTEGGAGGLLLADERHNITDQVLARLNEMEDSSADSLTSEGDQ